MSQKLYYKIRLKITHKKDHMEIILIEINKGDELYLN